GRLANGYVPEAPLGGTVSIGSAQLGALCTAAIAPNGSYRCEALIDTPLASADLAYDFQGAWGRKQIQTRNVALPRLGEQLTLPLDASVYPTTLRLEGQVTSAAGRPLAGAAVQVATDQGAIEGKTNQEGRYRLVLTLPAGQISGTLDYEVRYQTAAITATHAFNVPQDQLTTLKQDLIYGYRRAYFRGVVRNSYAIPMPFTTIIIDADELSAACQTQTAADGSYFCAAQTSATQPFSATLYANGSWGENIFVETVDANPEHDTITHWWDLLLNPSALRLTGRVTSPDGQPLAGVTLKVGGQHVFRQAEGATNEDGAYDFYVVLKTPAAANQISGTLSYQVGYDTTTILRLVPFKAQANQLGALNRDFALSTRVVSFSGVVQNALAPEGSHVYGSRVTVRSAELGTLCEYDRIDRFGTASYGCEAIVSVTQPFSIEYALDGPWGSAVITGSVATIPEVGQRLVVERTLEVSPTTIHLTGRVADRDGQPIGAASVQATSANFAQPLSLRTDEAGAYDGYAILAKGSAGAEISYQIRAPGDAPLAVRRQVQAEPGALTEHREDFTFPSRRFAVSGTLVNQTDPALPLGGRLIVVSPSLNQQLCDVEITGPAFACSTLVRTDDPFTLNVRVEGYWGGATRLNQQVPAGASAHTLELAAAPRVLRLQGAVSDSGGLPLPGAAVAITSHTVQPGREVKRPLVTDSAGRYATALVVADGVTAGEIGYAANRDGNTAAAEAAFAFDDTARLLTVTQNLTLTSRKITFSGQLINAHDARPGKWGPTRLTITSPAFGRLCEVDVSSDGSYVCSAHVTTDAPFDVTYAAAGSWGRVISSDRVATLPPIGGAGPWNHDLRVALSMLRLTGTVKDQTGRPLSGAVVEAASPVSSVWRKTAADSAGRYELALVLHQTDTPLSGILETLVSYRTVRANQNVSYTALPGSLVEATHDVEVEINERTIQISGNLINTLAPNLPGANPSGHIEILTPDGAPLCPMVRGDRYFCEARHYSDDPFEAIARVSANWGYAERRIIVENVPPPGEQISVQADIETQPTTLRVFGTVLSPAGGPFGNVIISVKADNGQTRHVKTNASGQFEAYLLIGGAARTTITYLLQYDGIQSMFTTYNVALNANQLNSRQETFTFEKRRIRFTGTVTNALVPGLAVPTRVVITSPDRTSERYCDAFSNLSTGHYMCDAFVRDGERIDVNYRITGAWGQADIPATITGIPEAGGSVEINRQLTVSPTTLLLSGQLIDPFGKPLAGAELTVSGGAVVQTVQLKTDDQGRYAGYMLLTPNTIAGELRYGISYYELTKTETRAFFGIRPGQLSPFAQDFEIASRQIFLGGRVRHALQPELGLKGRLVIAAPTIGTLCTLDIDADGTFGCAVPAITTDPFSVTHTVTADWGQAVVTGSIGFGVVGNSEEISHIVEASPTLLQLSGTAHNGANNPLPGVEIDVSGPGISATSWSRRNAVTDSQGRYRLSLVVKQGAEAGTLGYQLRYNSVRGALTVSYAAPARQRTEIVKDIPLAERTVTFRGTVHNGYAPAMLLPSMVYVSAPGIGDLCSSTTENNGKAYVCSVQVFNGESFPIEYRVEGTWGSATFAGVVPAGGVGGTTAVAQDFLPTPTTLRLVGTITDPDGRPLSGATVNLSGANLTQAFRATSAVSGTYELFAVVRAGLDSGTLNYQIQYDAAAITNQPFQRFPRNELTTIARDFTFATRNFEFSGRVYDTHAPHVALRGNRTQLTITAPGLGQLCAATLPWDSAAYRCQANLNLTEPISVEYALAGDWGAQTISGSILALPNIGGSARIERDLGIAPTTLRLTGIVRDGSGTPLQNAAVFANGATASGMTAELHAMTGASGAYELYAILKSGVTQDQLHYQLNYNNIRIYPSAPFAVAAGALGELTRDITVTERILSFSGEIQNALVPGVPLTATRVDVTTGTGVSCSWSYDSPRSSYGCTAQIPTAATFPVTYTVSGDWGSQVIAGVAGAGTVGAYEQVKRDLPLSPATLHVTGRVVDSGDTPLVGASVSLAGSGIAAGANLSAVTDSAGAYHLYPVLAEGVASGVLTSTATYNGAQVQGHGAYSGAGFGHLREVSLQPLTINRRNVSFAGTVVNAHVPAQPVDTTLVTVAAPGTGTLCEWRYSPNRTPYACSAQIETTNAFSVTYTVSGDWGSQVFTDTVPAGAVGSTLARTRNLAVVPTTIRVYGTIRQGDGNFLPSATIYPSGSNLAHRLMPNTSTSQAGAYELYVVLKQGVTAGNFNFHVSFYHGDLTEPIAFNLQPGTLAAIPHDVTFNTRQIVFSGNVQNDYASGFVGVPYERMTISAPALGTLCDTQAHTLAVGYGCTVDITTTNALNVNYMVSGQWGTAVFTGTVNAGEVGGNTQATRNLRVRPTTLRLHGVITNDAGTPQPGVRVSVSGADLAAVPPAASSALDGGYEHYLTLKQGITSGTLDAQLSANGVTEQIQIPFTAVGNQLTAVQRNAVLVQRQLRFSGSIVSSATPQQQLRSTEVIVSDAALGELCRWGSIAGATSYSCTATITASAPLSITYVVRGRWGETRLDNLVTIAAPAPGKITEVVRELAGKATLVHLYGTVTDDAGRPLGGAAVNVTGVNTINPMSGQTNSGGFYEIYG
ncbi:MAG TPA: hypothetical protein VD886_01265, partial [Herpetosiphonaceae bacterium]|nr:hypothetical protein [Herpetosiphonaceae bacterium]